MPALPPRVNALYRATAAGPRTRIYRSREASTWNSLVWAAARTSREGGPPAKPGKEVTVHLTFFGMRAGSDLDGPIKACLDSIQGILLDNDRDVVELHVYRGTREAPPATTITVTWDDR